MNEQLTAAVDVFALGITAIELISGRWGERLPLRADKYNAGRDAQIGSLRDPRWGSVWWRELEELLQDMLAFDGMDRPSAEHVQEVCTRLGEEVGGESLRRYARAVVPPLVEERRERMRDESLLPSADLLPQSDPDPSIVTASKTMMVAQLPKSTHINTTNWLIQLAVFTGLALSIWWFVSG